MNSVVIHVPVGRLCVESKACPTLIVPPVMREVRFPVLGDDGFWHEKKYLVSAGGINSPPVVTSVTNINPMINWHCAIKCIVPFVVYN